MRFLDSKLNPLEWGWTESNETFTPITTDVDIAPPAIKDIIRCNCKVTTKNPCSSKLCTCKKYGLPCVSSCTGCRGEDCDNCDVSYYSLILKVYISKFNLQVLLNRYLLKPLEMTNNKNIIQVVEILTNKYSTISSICCHPCECLHPFQVDCPFFV